MIQAVKRVQKSDKGLKGKVKLVTQAVRSLQNSDRG